MYKYLPDGRTQRFKTAEGKLYEPQDALVFVPPYEWVKENAPPAILKRFDNATIYDETLLSYVQESGKTTMIADSQGRRTETNEKIAACEGSIFLAFIDKPSGKVDFQVPVSKEPKVGWMTYDTRESGEGSSYQRERHLGNSVTEIVLKKT